MRRALMTVRKAVSLLTIGYPNPPNTGTAVGRQRLVVALSGAASATGTITQIQLDSQDVSTIVYPMTGTVSGTLFTVRSVGSAITLTATAQTVTVSLPVVAGDYLAFYGTAGGGGSSGIDWNSSGSGSIGYHSSSPTSVPTPGAVLSFTMTPGRLHAGGTG